MVGNQTMVSSVSVCEAKTLPLSYQYRQLKELLPKQYPIGFRFPEKNTWLNPGKVRNRTLVSTAGDDYSTTEQPGKTCEKALSQVISSRLQVS